MARGLALSEDLAFSLPQTRAQRLWTRAVAAVAPERLVGLRVHRDGPWLALAGRRVDLRRIRRTLVLAAGKAAAGMTRGLLPHLAGPVTGLIVVPRGGTDPLLALRQVEAAHPVPDGRSVLAAHLLEEAAASAGAEDLVIVLLSGGASALLADPVPGITLGELQRTTAALLAAGVPIDGLNAVRKHLGRLKGGGLAALASPAQVVTLVISDVPDDRLDVIASGPSVPDPSTYAEALAAAEMAATIRPVPAAVLAHLAAGVAGRHPETAKGDEPFWSRQAVALIGGRATLLQAAREAAGAEGLAVTVQDDPLQGEAAEAGRAIAARLAAMRQPGCWLAAGETTVTLGPAPGHGGRSQELALAAALAMADRAGIGLLAAGSDGIDGPTDAAGAWADGSTVRRGQARGRDAAAALIRHDAHPYFRACGGLWQPGPTGTNAGDLVIGLVWPDEDTEDGDGMAG